jgi:hypothetical protein
MRRECFRRRRVGLKKRHAVSFRTYDELGTAPSAVQCDDRPARAIISKESWLQSVLLAASAS